MNKVILMGRLTANPEVRYTQDQKAVANYTLAVDRRTAKDAEKKTDFIRCVAWEKRAEFAEKWLQKGTKVVVTGRIQTGSYTDRETGKKVYTTDIMVEECEFAESKASSEEKTAPDDQVPPPMPDDNGFMEIPDSLDAELPFN